MIKAISTKPGWSSGSRIYTLLPGAALLFALGATPSVYAATGETQALSTSGGIASPGGPTAYLQNPAGLVFNPGVNLTLQGGASDSFNNPVLRGGLLGGGESYGLAGGVTQTTGDPKLTDVFFGLAVRAQSFSLGVSGFTGISPGGGSHFNAGLLHQGQAFQLGVTAFGLDSGVDEWGAGVAIPSSSSLTWVVDTAYDRRSQSFGLKPGVRVDASQASLSLSYGFVNAKETEQLADGFTAGGSLRFGASSSFQIYYNVFKKVYAALTFGI